MGEFCVYNKEYVGKCFWTERRSRISSVFSYDDGYLLNGDNWNIDPTLEMVSGAQPAKFSIPGVLLDASPDRWGKTLIRHRHMRNNKERSNLQRRLNDIDYLLGVSDFSRQGELRFSYEKDGLFLHPADECPKLVSLPKLLDAANRYAEYEDENAIEYLLDAGSASLGGARPKAAVADGDELYIAKFPHRQDKWDVIAWEWVSLCIASEAGICVPDIRLVSIDGQKVLLTKRFDREREKRIGYISAMTLLGLADGEQADYSEIAEKMRTISVDAKKDLHELFRRIVLFIHINNTDDHLRNHGFLRKGSGWNLSPVFDVNPNPERASVRGTSIFGETGREASLKALLNNAYAFDLEENTAIQISSEVKKAVESFEKYTKEIGVSEAERSLMRRCIV